MSAQENKAIVHRVFAELNKHNFAVLDETMDPDYVHHDPAFPPHLQQGRDNYKQGVAMFYTAFPDLTGTIDDLCAEGDKVATRLTWHGVHQGDLMGILATGKQVAFTMIVIHRIADGKLAEGWANFDALGMMQQLGVIPVPGQAAG